MEKQEHNCPFLNRPDERCSRYFHIDHLEHALGHCFDQFESCSVYAERVIERQARRQADPLEHSVAQGVSHAGEADRQPTRQPLVQVTLSTRLARAFRRTQKAPQSVGYAQHAAAVEDVPALSGV